MNDIMDAVPIDKYFELFKPGQGGEGGFIRIGMDYVKSLKDRDSKSAGGAHPLSPNRPYGKCRIITSRLHICTTQHLIWLTCPVSDTASHVAQLCLSVAEGSGRPGTLIHSQC